MLIKDKALPKQILFFKSVFREFLFLWFDFHKKNIYLACSSYYSTLLDSLEVYYIIYTHIQEYSRVALFWGSRFSYSRLIHSVHTMQMSGHLYHHHRVSNQDDDEEEETIWRGKRSNLNPLSSDSYDSLTHPMYLKELHRQQNQEIMAHRHRRATHHNNNNNYMTGLSNNNTPTHYHWWEDWNRFGSVVTEAVREAYQKAHRKMQQQDGDNSPHDSLWEDFGIPREEESPSTTNTTTLHYTEFGSSRMQDTQQQHDFVLLDRFRWKQNQWGAVPNLDLYFTNLYSYYYNRGFVPLFCKGIVGLVTLFFTLFLSLFLFAYVDWHALSLCHDEATCHPHLGHYLHHRPLQQFSLLGSTLILTYSILFFIYGAFAILSFFHTVQAALQSKFIFEQKLGISARRLEGGAIDWDRDVVAKIASLQESGEYRIVVNPNDHPLDAHSIANRILRKENFLIALFNKGLLDLTLPFFAKDTVFFSDSLEWTLYFCVLNFMFNHRYQLRPAFYLDPASLKRRFILCGIAHAVFMPFLVFFLALHFGFKHVYDWKNSKRYLGPRDWSTVAKWTFREFNELQHFFERRLSPSYAAADGYLQLFGTNEIVAAMGRILVFMGGSLGAVLIVFAAINDAVLLHVKIADWNLLWYAGVFGVIYSIGKAMIPPPEAQVKNARNLFAEIDAALANVATHTHYLPDHWRKRGWKSETFKKFSSMYKFKAQLFAMELVSLLVAPYILCVSLVRCAEPICDFVVSVRAETASSGDVCGYATFDFEVYEDENWEGRTIGDQSPVECSMSESIMRFGNVEEAARRHPKPKCRHGKMEKSFFTFKANNPSWKCGPSGQRLVNHLENYRKTEEQTVSRERQLYIEAAARQLETLTRLQNGGIAQEGSPINLRESYLSQSSYTSADAGAGSMNHPLPVERRGQQSKLESVPEDDDAERSFAQVSGLPPPLSLPVQTTPRTGYGDILSSDTIHSNPSFHSSMIHSSLPGSLGISSDFRRILNTSHLNTMEESILLGLVPDPREVPPVIDDPERQYLWLERYHSHLAAQRAGAPAQDQDPDILIRNSNNNDTGARPNERDEPEHVNSQRVENSIV